MPNLKLYLQLLRRNDWWLYKISFLLTVIFLSFAQHKLLISQYFTTILELFIYFIIAASFVSIINDYYDQEEDKIANKKNGFLRLDSNKIRKQILLLAYLIIILTILSLYNKPFAFLSFLLGFVSYLAYSIKGIRLKSKGALGVIADAAGAHYFSALFIVSFIEYATKVHIDILWYFAISTWSFCFGLRGIIWHQHQDKQNDILSKTNTFLTTINNSSLNIYSRLIFLVETFILIWILIKTNIIMVIPLTLYLLLIFLRKKLLGFELTIATNHTQKFHIIGAEFYEFILPISLLFLASIETPYLIIWIVIFPLLFPKRPLEIALDVKNILTQKWF